MSNDSIRVIFTRKKAIGSVLLRAALWSAWSHCALIRGDKIIEAAGSTGVVQRPLADLIAESSEYEILEFPCADPDKIYNAAATQLGKKYDWLGVLGIGFRRRWQDDSSWFCSELVAWAFDQAGQPLFRVQHWRITPRDLYISTAMTRKPTVVEGEGNGN